MGWAQGSYLAENIWQDVKEFIPKKDHREAALRIVNRFENEDADDWGDQEVYKIAYRGRKPSEKKS